MAYLLTWWSTVWGLGLASRIFHPAVEGAQSYDFHEFVSLLALAFMLLHIGVLMLDHFLPFNLAQLLIPFISTYRPVWVGLGVISLYTLALVTVTFYLRRVIGAQAFRSIHLLSLLGYAGVTLHGLFAGTDSGLPAAKLMYAGTFLGVGVPARLLARDERAREARARGGGANSPHPSAAKIRKLTHTSTRALSRGPGVLAGTHVGTSGSIGPLQAQEEANDNQARVDGHDVAGWLHRGQGRQFRLGNAGPAVHTCINDLEHRYAALRYGRRLYKVMKFWED